MLKLNYWLVVLILLLFSSFELVQVGDNTIIYWIRYSNELELLAVNVRDVKVGKKYLVETVYSF